MGPKSHRRSMAELVHPLPYAPASAAWSYVERSELGVHGACDVLYRAPAPEGAELPKRLRPALPVLLHEFDQARDVLDALPVEESTEMVARGHGVVATLTRVLPRLLTFRYIDSEGVREFVFEGNRPSALHVLARVLDSPFKFRLEDLSRFATHGELLLHVLDGLGLPAALDPEATLYCPAVDSPYPFKFVVVGEGRPNREVYVDLLKQLLRQTETDETFRARHFRELSRGFQKFGPGAATPQFQEVELRLWRLLSYTAARLRVMAGRLTSTSDPEQVQDFLVELRGVHDALDDLEHLPGRLAAFYRTHFDLEFGKLYEHALAELDVIAERVDCELTERRSSIDEIAATVSEFRRLGSASPLETLEEKDREILVAYGDVEVPEPKRGWARTYDEAIFTGAARFDQRRFGGSDVGDLSEEDWALDLNLDFSEGVSDEGELDEIEDAGMEDSAEEDPDSAPTAPGRTLFDEGALDDMDLDAAWGEEGDEP